MGAAEVVRVAAIPGSVRAGSVNRAVVDAIAALAPPDVTVDVWDGLGTLPLFSPDLDGDTVPVPVAEVRARLAAADAVIVCTPEYAFGMPGALKNALDWLVASGELNRKPVAALSASPSADGGVRALAWLRQTLTAMDAIVPPAATFAVPFVRQRLGDGSMTNRLCGVFTALRAPAGAETIRPFGPLDHDGVVALWSEVFADDPPRNAPAEMIARKTTVQPELFLLAIEDGAVVGTVIGGFDGVRGWIHHLAVQPRRRRGGIASRLMARAEEGLAALGCPKVNLQVRADNVAVVAFYEHAGYAVEDRLSMGKAL
jgi:NAD(P)H-dependent FMN reductase/ribosomal protein S18 acetylase RimI-like enzyme